MNNFSNQRHRIGGVMVSVLTSSVVDHGFKPWSGQINDYKIDVCCFSDKHTTLKTKDKNQRLIGSESR